jgi:hypothetical protein
MENWKTIDNFSILLYALQKCLTFGGQWAGKNKPHILSIG